MDPAHEARMAVAQRVGYDEAAELGIDLRELRPR